MNATDWPPSTSTIVLAVVALLLLVLVVVLVVALVRTWLQRRLYTRERFAFFALTSYVGCFGLFVALASGGGPLIGLAVQIVNNYAGTTFTFPEPSFGVVVLALLFFGGLAVASYQMFANWDGSRSVASQVEESASPTVVAFFREGILFVRSPDSRVPAQKVATSQPIVLGRLDREPWNVRARRLLELKSNSYQFEEHYHDRDEFWTGTTRDRETRFYMLCVDEPPGRERLAEFVARVKHHAGLHQVAAKQRELLVAVERGEVAAREPDVDKAKFQVSSEAQMLDELVNFATYRKDIARRATELANVYVERRVNGGEPLSRVVREWLSGPTDKQLALLGDYGYGKTSAALMLCDELLREPKPPRIPILIELRGRSPRNLSQAELLALWGSRYRIDADALQVLHESERLLLIFEGLDEVDLVGEEKVRLEQTSALWAFAYGNVRTKLMFTTRPNFAFGDREVIAELGGAEHCTILRLDPFDIDDIRQALRNSANRESIAALAEKDDFFRELVSRPFMLSVIDQIWSRLKDMPSINGASAMKLYLDSIYEREAERDADAVAAGKLQTELRLTTAERRYFMRSIATDMTKNSASVTNSINRAQYDRVMSELIRRLPETLVSDTEEAVRLKMPLAPLRKRIPAGKIGEETFKRLTQARSLLVNDERDRDRLKFAHKSFMEYLAAEAHAAYVLARHAEKALGDESPFVTSGLILNYPEDSPVVKWFAQILRNSAAEGVHDEVEVCRRLHLMLVHPRGGSLASLRMVLHRRILARPVLFWTSLLFLMTVALFFIWGYVLDLRENREGIAPYDFLAIVVCVSVVIGGLYAVKFGRNYLSLAGFSTATPYGMAVVVLIAALGIRWQFGLVTLAFMLPLWSFSVALPWVRVWQTCCRHLNLGPEVQLAALGPRAR